MSLDNLLVAALERASQDLLLKQAVYCLLTKEGGSVTLPLKEVMNDDDMGGIKIEVDKLRQTISLEAVRAEAVDAMVDSVGKTKTLR